MEDLSVHRVIFGFHPRLRYCWSSILLE